MHGITDDTGWFLAPNHTNGMPSSIGNAADEPVQAILAADDTKDPPVKALIFDMDGTTLHTLPDLAIAANEALGQMGFPARTYEDILSFMGEGSWRLIERCLPPSSTQDQCGQVFDLWRRIYIASSYENTLPFPGMVDTLRELRSRGMKTAILSNKFDEGARLLAEVHFPGLFDIVRGDKAPTPRKPDPTGLLRIVEELGVEPHEAAYVGDTLVDLEVAENAGMMFIGVSWGYDKAAPLPQDRVDVCIHDPHELLSLPSGKERRRARANPR